jgi:hypothetical protein
MAVVQIPVNELTQFDLPKVCVVTGRTDGVVFKPVKFQWYPRWIAVFAFAPLIMVIVMMALMRRVKGELPFTEEAHAAWRKGQLMLTLSIVGAFVLFFGAMGAFGNNVPVLGLLMLAAAVGTPIFVGVRVRGRGVSCLKIADGSIALKIPNEGAAMQLSEHLRGSAGRKAAA